ncbi:EF-hand calcium-binding domain-containing protein 11 isoform X5 [Camelus dromedarius]|uniref:EF-hand calcium-binding domain-containing protein 11 isoform X5 n=1 Tax=Camelus dromedarius TaxID=9838 RepID=UPI003119E6AE
MFFSQAGARPQMWEVSPSEHKKWVEVFKACDEDNKGYLSREDFKVAVVMLFGYKPSKIEADSVMSSVDPNTSVDTPHGLGTCCSHCLECSSLPPFSQLVSSHHLGFSLNITYSRRSCLHQTLLYRRIVVTVFPLLARAPVCNSVYIFN